MKLNQAKSKLLEDGKLKQAFQRKDIDDLKISIGLQILELRIIKGVTQHKLAKMIGTAQPSIARAERGALLPSLDFLHKIAKALETDLIYPRFVAVEQKERSYQIASFFGVSSPKATKGQEVEVVINKNKVLTEQSPLELADSVTN